MPRCSGTGPLVLAASTHQTHNGSPVARVLARHLVLLTGAAVALDHPFAFAWRISCAHIVATDKVILPVPINWRAIPQFALWCRTRDPLIKMYLTNEARVLQLRGVSALVLRRGWMVMVNTACWPPAHRYRDEPG